MNRITKIREEIGGKQVDLTFYGRFCSLIEDDRKIILRAIKNGRKKGAIGAIQPGRHDRIWTTWSVAFDDLKVGDTVEFSTSGKYNPGFHATEKYVGCVEWIKGSECAIKTGKGIAVVLMLKKCAEICERYDKRIKQAEAEKKIMLCVFDYGLSTDNAIYYPHLNTLSFNWNSYGKKITQEEFDDFVNKVDRSQLPEGIKFELK